MHESLPYILRHTWMFVISPRTLYSNQPVFDHVVSCTIGIYRRSSLTDRSCSYVASVQSCHLFFPLRLAYLNILRHSRRPFMVGENRDGMPALPVSPDTLAATPAFMIFQRLFTTPRKRDHAVRLPIRSKTCVQTPPLISVLAAFLAREKTVFLKRADPAGATADHRQNRPCTATSLITTYGAIGLIGLSVPH